MPGSFEEILVEEGATVPNNADIAVIETADDANGTAAATAPAAPVEAATAAEPSAPAEPAHGPAGSDERPAPAAPDERPAPAAPASAPAAASATVASAAPAAPTIADIDAPGNPDARMTPAVRRLLREHGLAAAQIVGTGGGGRITRDDVTNFVESQRTGQPVGGQSAAVSAGAATQAQPAAAAATQEATTPATTPPATSVPGMAAPAAPAAAPARPGPAHERVAASGGTSITFPDGVDEFLVPLTQMRKGIAVQMTKALQAPHAYVQMEVDVTRLVAFREKVKRDYQAREGIGLSYVPFVVKASAEALKRNPTFNAVWTDQGVVAKRRVNIGVAVAVDDGLIVPVIRDADQLSIHGLNVAIADVAARAKVGKFKVEDFGGGTFTVDNTGYLGTNLVMPILNVPEVGIVTMEAITKRPVVVSTPDGDVIAIRPIMNMVLGVDHRANDGAGGSALLRDIKAWLESVGPDTPVY